MADSCIRLDARRFDFFPTIRRFHRFGVTFTQTITTMSFTAVDWECKFRMTTSVESVGMIIKNQDREITS